MPLEYPVPTDPNEKCSMIPCKNFDLSFSFRFRLVIVKFFLCLFRGMFPEKFLISLVIPFVAGSNQTMMLVL